MSVVHFRQAIADAIDEEMQRDPDVVLFGEDVAIAGGVFQTTRGLQATHGPERVFDTPISELALTGAAFGSAITGLRPIIEMMFGDFCTLSMDGLVNHASKHWFLSNETVSVPLVVRTAVGGGGRFGPIHSQVPAAWHMSVPGLKIVAPATPADAKGLLKAAIRDDNPVLFMEHKMLYAMKGEVGTEAVPLSKARVARSGTDLTIVTAMKGVHDALVAADELAASGIDVEVIDLRTLRPLDLETILRSVRRTRRVLVVEEGPRTGGWAAEVLASIVEEALGEFEDAWRLTNPDLPLPVSPPLEDAFLPSSARIIADVRSRFERRATP